MEKKSIYPKTKRLPLIGAEFVITEKLDGSNMNIFKKNGEIYVAQRDNIYHEDELINYKESLVKGFYGWFDSHKKYFKENLYEGSVICGEWLGTGILKYPNFDKRFYMFAKANIKGETIEEFELEKIRYNHDLFIYPFIDQVIPDFIGVVPIVAKANNISISYLDKLYDEYSNKVGRNVEGFVVEYSDTINKYVRMKKGRLEDHHE